MGIVVLVFTGFAVVACLCKCSKERKFSKWSPRKHKVISKISVTDSGHSQIQSLNSQRLNFILKSIQFSIPIYDFLFNSFDEVFY